MGISVWKNSGLSLVAIYFLSWHNVMFNTKGFSETWFMTIFPTLFRLWDCFVTNPDVDKTGLFLEFLMGIVGKNIFWVWKQTADDHTEVFIVVSELSNFSVSSSVFPEFICFVLTVGSHLDESWHDTHDMRRTFWAVSGECVVLLSMSERNVLAF